MSNRRIAVAGHAGIGHVDGFGGFIQDDSAGFITTASLVKDHIHVDTNIKEVNINLTKNTIQIITMDGGSSTSSPRRGITPKEAELMKSVINRDALYCQYLTVNTLGRMYGQGVLETPVSFQGALANSVVDTFKRKEPEKFKVAQEDIKINCGLLGGMMGRINNINISYLMSVNQTKHGIGPVEDFEGNIALGAKRKLMIELEMLKCPTVILESKAYLPTISNQLKNDTFLIRAQEGIDNKIVAKALFDAAEELGYPVIFRNDLLPKKLGFMKQNTNNFAENIINYGKKLRKAELASEKVLLVSELAKLISQDAGSITCISNKIHDIVRGAGMIPGTAAVLSMLVTKEYYNHWKIPLFDKVDAEKTKNIVKLAINKLKPTIDEAYEYLEPIQY